MEEKNNVLEEQTEVKEEETEVTEEVVDEQEEASEELSEYDAKIAEYEYRLEEAFVNIEIKENVALANPEDEAAIKAYKDAKANYEALRKEYKQFKKDNRPVTWWTTLPLRVKVISFFNLIFAFPLLSWSVIPIWYYPYSWLYDLFSDGLNKLYDNGKMALVYTYLGAMWYSLILVLIIWLVIVLVIGKNKKDINPKYKKTYIGFIIGNGVFELGLLIYQIVLMIQSWS